MTLVILCEIEKSSNSSCIRFTVELTIGDYTWMDDEKNVTSFFYPVKATSFLDENLVRNQPLHIHTRMSAINKYQTQFTAITEGKRWFVATGEWRLTFVRIITHWVLHVILQSTFYVINKVSENVSNSRVHDTRDSTLYALPSTQTVS